MPSSTSTAVPRSSDAIQRGADLLLELFNEEQSQLIHACRENFENRFNLFKAQVEARIASADSKSVEKMALSKKIFTQYDRSVRDLEVARNELQHVKGEYAKLMASIEEVGLVYMNGTLHFNETTAEIVSDFREGALISHKNPKLDMAPKLLPPDHDTEAFSKPSDFFLFLARYAHVLKTQQQSRFGNASMNDATPESEQTLAFPVSPSTY